jgi:hypothetical protein
MVPEPAQAVSCFDPEQSRGVDGSTVFWTLSRPVGHESSCIARTMFPPTRPCVRLSHTVQLLHRPRRSLCATLSVHFGGIIAISHDDLLETVSTYSCADDQTLGSEVSP